MPARLQDSSGRFSAAPPVLSWKRPKVAQKKPIPIIADHLLALKSIYIYMSSDECVLALKELKV